MKTYINLVSTMLKHIMGAICALTLIMGMTSCHEDRTAAELRDADQTVIRIDRKTLEHMQEGCTPREVFFCQDCQVWHILFDEYDYND